MAVDPYDSLRKRLAMALHAHCHYGEARSWDQPPKDFAPFGWGKHYLEESSKDAWYEMADRFMTEIGPKFGLAFISKLITTAEEAPTMDLKAELSPEAKKYYREDDPFALKAEAWSAAYASFLRVCPTTWRSVEEGGPNCYQWAIEKANRYWPIYLEQVSLQWQGEQMSQKMSDANVALEQQDIREVKRKVRPVTLELITGGKPPEDPTLNWLEALEIGTAFLVREKMKGKSGMPRYALMQYYLVNKFAKAVLLSSQTNGDNRGFVDPKYFVLDYDLHEILYDPKTMPPIERTTPTEDEAVEPKSEEETKSE